MGFYDLAALGSLLWLLVFRTALVYSGRFLGAVRPARWPPIIKWLWRFAWMLWLLAAITFVVLRIRYPVGGDITISPHVPLMEHVLQVLALGGVVGGYIIVHVWWFALTIYEARVRSRGHERSATTMRQSLSQRLGRGAVVILLLVITLVVASWPLIIVFIMLNTHEMPH